MYFETDLPIGVYNEGHDQTLATEEYRGLIGISTYSRHREFQYHLILPRPIVAASSKQAKRSAAPKG